jgi:hypothetical protein
MKQKPKNSDKNKGEKEEGGTTKQKKGWKAIKKLKHKKMLERGEKNERKTNIKKAMKEEEPKIKLMQKNFNI